MGEGYENQKQYFDHAVEQFHARMFYFLKALLFSMENVTNFWIDFRDWN